jgi:hypothetical protein
MEKESKTPYWPNEEPLRTGGQPFPEEPELPEIDISQLTPDQKAILALRLAKKPHAQAGEEARMLISEINSRALNENTSPEVAAKKILQEEQESK